MISAWHLVWIIPVVGSIGFLVAALMHAGRGDE
jgi:hypothetical protein